MGTALRIARTSERPAIEAARIEGQRAREAATAAEPDPGALDEALDFRTRALRTLADAGVPFLVTGAYAFFEYTGIRRDTKDLDVALRLCDLPAAFRALDAVGFRTEVHHERWLGKAWSGAHFVDLIFSSRNGLTPVDDEWFQHARTAMVLGMPMPIAPAEELLWSKAFVHERERFDGADVDHLIHASGEHLDWARLVRRFGAHWEVLLAHLILYRYAFPAARSKVPTWVMRELLGRAQSLATRGDLDDPICRGHLVSGSQYAIDYANHGLVHDPTAPPAPADVFSLSALDVGAGGEGEPIAADAADAGDEKGVSRG